MRRAITRDTRQYGDAETHYRNALAIDPKEGRAYMGLGNVYFDRHRYSQAIDAYQRAIQVRTDYAEAYSNLAYCYMRVGKAVDAEREVRKALVISQVGYGGCETGACLPSSEAV